VGLLEQHLKRLEQQNEDMLTNIDHKQLVKELDYECQYSSQTKVEIVGVLYRIKHNHYGLYDKKKLQKLINHYAIEHANVLALKS
jgi:hypothetical protein